LLALCNYMLIFTIESNQKTETMKYTASKINGAGQVIEENDTHVTVYFEDTDTEKVLIKSLVTFYNSIEEANNSILEAEERSDVSISESKMAQMLSNTYDNEDMNNRSKFNQRSSSMR